MKTIKIIDLLNKIANDEEVPKKIKWGCHIYTWTAGEYIALDELDKPLFSVQAGYLKFVLNNKVEIIEEDNEIQSIDVEYYKANDERYNELLEEIASFQEWCIDKINSLEKEQ